MAYTLPSWADSPSTASPLSAANLTLGNTAINDLDTRATKLERSSQTVRADNPPTGSGLTALSADGSTDDRGRLQAMLDYVDSTWGSGQVVLPPGRTIKVNSGISLAAGVQLVALEQTVLNFSALTGTSTAVTVNDTDFTPLVGVKLVGPGKSSTVTGLSVSGTGQTFDRITVREFGTAVNLAHNNTYINRFIGCDIGESGLCVNQDLFDAGATNAGERTVFTGCAFFNSDQFINVQSNQGGLFFTNCSVDYCKDYGLTNDSHVIFTGCHLESNYSTTTPNSYMFNPGYENRLVFTGCNFIMSAVGGEGLRFIINPASAPSNVTKGRVLFDNCLAYFIDSGHTGQQRFSEEFLQIAGSTTSLSFETPFVSNWSPVTAMPGANQGDTQAQATVTAAISRSGSTVTGSVTITAPSTVTGGTVLPVRIKF